MYVFQMFDYYACNGACILFLAVFETLAVGWIFGGYMLHDTKSLTHDPDHLHTKWDLVIFKYTSNLLSFVGADRLCDIIEDMTGERANPFFKVCWLYLTPLVSLVSWAFIERMSVV